MPMRPVNWAGKVMAVARKDILTECRTRYAINAVAMFSVVTLAVISFALGILNPSGEIMAALFWVVLFFAAMSGLAQSFVREEEAGTALILRLTAHPLVIFFGKLLFNLIFVISLTILVVPLYIILLHTSPTNWLLFLAGLIPGLVGLSGATTILAAIVSRASVKGVLFTVLSFPVLMPLFFAVIEITKAAFTGGVFNDIAAPWRLLIAYDVVMITASVMLFDYVWR
jgi:heme exporter protein B